MSNYGGNVYRDISPYKVPVVESTEKLTKPNKVDGFYNGGRIIVKRSSLRPSRGNNNYFIEYTFNSINTQDITANSRTAILAVPIKFTDSITSTPPNEYMQNFIKKHYKDFTPYLYYIISFSNAITKVTSMPTAKMYTESNNWYNYRVEGQLKGSGLNQQVPTQDFSNTLPFVGRLYDELLRLHNYDDIMTKAGFPVIVNDTIEKLTKAIDDFPVLSSLYFTFTNFSQEYNGIIGTDISSNMPIFTVDNLDQLANYFDNEEWTSENEEDLAVSDIDLRTDWTIYVKGAQNPKIITTCLSESLEKFLASDDNKIGLTTSDVAIEFRYPLYNHDATKGFGLDSSEYTFDSYVFDGGWIYGDNKNDTYESLVFQNYPYLQERFSLDSLLFGGTSEARINVEKRFYSQLQFRLKIGENKFSSWCYFKIGVIGSPNIPDFSQMENEGNVYEGNYSDGSTVTIIYDELPTNKDDDDYVDPIDPSDIDPTDPTPIDPTTGVNGGLNMLTTSYLLTDEQVRQLATFLWSASFLQNLSLVNNSPIENIVGCKLVPIALSGSSSIIKIGNVDTNVNGDIINNVPIVDLGSVNLSGYYGNFLDYAPFTQIIIFLPFIGFTEIDTNLVVGHTLNVKYCIDIVTGVCKAMLYIDNIYYSSYDGSCCIDIPLVASNRAQVEASLLGSVVNGVMNVDPVGLTNSVVSAQYHSQSSGSYSPTCGWQETKQCYVVINRPICQYPSSYGHDIGYPCKLTRSLLSLSGFTVCDSSIDLKGITCTNEERNMLYNLLTTGVYL